MALRSILQRGRYLNLNLPINKAYCTSTRIGRDENLRGGGGGAKRFIKFDPYGIVITGFALGYGLGYYPGRNKFSEAEDDYEEVIKKNQERVERV